MSEARDPEAQAGEYEGCVAIVGMAGRFPGARDLDEFWGNLRDGRETVTRFTAEEVAGEGAGGVVAVGGVLDDIDRFDAAFFGISPNEAEVLDPQHRLFLECAWAAVENAGYGPSRCPRVTAVYGGCSLNTYHLTCVRGHRQRTAALNASTLNAATTSDFLTMRVAHLLDLQGPCATLHTACSTSLVAVVHAWQSLLNYQCDMALAGGVTVRVPQRAAYSLEREAILSQDGHCRPFDAAAAGTVSGEGVGVVALRRCEDALRDGDPILAVIRGAAVNNEGFNKVSVFAPSVEGQAKVVAAALEIADVSSDSIDLVEAHGTGTPLGDPIEVAALQRAFAGGTDRRGYCALGSVKSNIGHADAAAGVAGLIKVVLALQHEAMPPSLHYERPNPEIDFGQSPFFVNDALRPWPRGARPRRAGVSSFGMGGTNAHVVLEEAPAPAPVPAPAPARRPDLLLLSAKSAAALDRASGRLAAHLEAQPTLALHDVAYTLHRGRDVFWHRRAIVAADRSAAIAALRGGQNAVASAHTASPARVAFAFPGQGAQHVGMGSALYEHEPVFRQHLDAAAEVLRDDLGLDLRTVLFATSDREAAAAQLAETWLTQPALFAVEYALARTWMALGIEPGALVGHSVGELVAASIAGVMQFEDAARLVALRGRLLFEQPRGDMLSVAAAEAELAPRLPAEVSLAAINAPGSCVVSGPAAAVADLRAQLEAEQVPCRVLHTSHAFHSPMMQPAVQPFVDAVRRCQLRPATVPWVSTVTGDWLAAEAWAEPEYWGRNLREPVRFADAAATLSADDDRVLLEVGPGESLVRLARQVRGGKARGVVASMPHPSAAAADAEREAFVAAVGRLWVAGAAVDVDAYWGSAVRPRVSLPSYPFEPTRHWLEPVRETADAPAQRAELADWFYVPTWQPSPRAAQRGGRRAVGGCSVVVGDAGGLGAALASALRADGGRAVVVTPAAAFAVHEADAVALRVADAGDWRALWEHIGGDGPCRWISLLACEPAVEEAAAQDAFAALLAVGRVVGERGGALEIIAASDDLCAVVPGDAPRSAERALALGPVRVLQQEEPGLRCRHVDLPRDGSAAEHSALLVEECGTLTEDLLVAYRDGRRWVAVTQAVRLDAVDPAAVLPPRADGACLITGGLGGIGAVLARALVEAGRRQLVLLGRAALPPRQEWPAVLDAADAEDRTAERMRAVQALEAAGADVELVCADVADPSAVRAAVARAVERFGAVHTVIHAAGLPTSGTAALQENAAAAALPVLAPKVRGTVALMEALAEQPVELFVACSSVASWLGGAGGSDYCGANAVLDALAETVDRPVPGRYVSVGWDLWAEVGLATRSAVPAALQAARERALALAIRPAEGVQALARILSTAMPHVLVSTTPFDARLRDARRPPPERPANGAAEVEAGHQRPELATQFEAPEGEIEEALAEIGRELLGIDGIGRHDDWFELGLDSLSSHRLIARVQRDLDVTLPLRTVMETPQIEALAQAIRTTQWAARARARSKRR